MRDLMLISLELRNKYTRSIFHSVSQEDPIK